MEGQKHRYLIWFLSPLPPPPLSLSFFRSPHAYMMRPMCDLSLKGTVMTKLPFIFLRWHDLSPSTICIYLQAFANSGIFFLRMLVQRGQRLRYVCLGVFTTSSPSFDIFFFFFALDVACFDQKNTFLCTCKLLYLSVSSQNGPSHAHGIMNAPVQVG